MKLLFKKVWRIQTITQLNLCSLKRPIVIGDQGYNNLFNGLFVRKILLTTSVPAYNHVKKQTTRQLIGRTILTSNTCKNCCIKIFTCTNFTPVKNAGSKFTPARILHLQKLLHPNFHLQESAKSQIFQDICCTGAPPPEKKIKELTEKNYLLKPKAQDWCKTWTSLASKGYHGS